MAWQLLLRQMTPYPSVAEDLEVAQGVVSGSLDLRTSLPAVPKDTSSIVAALCSVVRCTLEPTPAHRPTAVMLVTELTAIREQQSAPVVPDAFYLPPPDVSNAAKTGSELNNIPPLHLSNTTGHFERKQNALC